MVLALPIGEREFLHMMQRCKPPVGWPTSIGVAYSGGADSTCLLFLLRQLALSRKIVSRSFPRTVHPFYVDHGLQEASDDMAEAALRNARRVGTEPYLVRIPWGEPPYPPRPQPGETMEGIARHARYQILFKAMMQHDANVIAFGHHADDQVETALMRFSQGSTDLGLAGMRPVRRWGMGFSKEHTLGWFGHEGMSRWIIRPLLGVGKDRILATCEENKLEYVEDKTNFQPELTLRNAIRHMLAQQADTTQAPAVKRIRPPPPTDGGMAGSLRAMVTRSENDNSLVPFDVTGSRQELQGAALAASENLGDVESKVTSYLNRHVVTSPPSTILIASDKLPAVPDRMVQMAMVLRILRCVSPVPWGSMLSQGGRRTASLVRVVERLWDSDPNSLERKAFEAGGRVLWTPMRICANGRLKYLTPRPGERFGWIASRAPPEHWRHFELRFDLTDTLRRALSRAQQEMRAVDEEILYDHRFLLRLRLQDQEDVVCQALLSGQGRVIVEAETRWFWPRVTLQRPGLDDIVLARVASPEMFWYEHPRQFSDEPPDLPLWHDKMDIQFIRVLDEI